MLAGFGKTSPLVAVAFAVTVAFGLEVIVELGVCCFGNADGN